MHVPYNINICTYIYIYHLISFMQKYAFLIIAYPIELLTESQQCYKVDTIISIEDEEADPREYVIFPQLV